MIDDLIKALRCSATPIAQKTNKCEECKFRYLEPKTDDIPMPADVVIDGVEYWQSCDVDRIALESADMLENLKGE